MRLDRHQCGDVERSCRKEEALVIARLWNDMCTSFDGCSGTVCAVGGEGREANARTALLLANARS